MSSRRPQGLLRLLPLVAVVVAVLLQSCIAPADATQDTVRKMSSSSSTTTPMQTELDVQPVALSATQLSALLDKLDADGVTTVSTGANWASLQPTESGPIVWEYLDRLVEGARARGLKVRLRLQTAPAWLHPALLANVAPAQAQWYPPLGSKELEQWKHFVTLLLHRYGSRLQGVETWNEPNEPTFWQPSPDPTAFAALLRATWTAVKAVRPDLPVTSGGLSHNDVGYLQRTYQALEVLPGALAQRFFFDQLGIHPYSADRSPDVTAASAAYHGTFGEVDENFSSFTKLQQVMSAAGDPGKKLWVSEYGFSTVGNSWFGPVPDDRRALFLLRAYARLSASGAVAGFGWYHSHPTPWDPTDYDILGPNLEESVTYKALKQVTGRTPRLKLPAPVSPGSHITGTLTTSISTPLAVAEVQRSEMFVDGQLVATGQRNLSWDTRGTPNGGHTLVVSAYSTDGAWASTPTFVYVVN